MMRSLAWLSYQAALGAGMALAAPVLALRKGAHYKQALRGRLAMDLGSPDGVERLWIHAVSVGETAVATTLIRRLPEEIPLVVTTVTPTGQEQARKALAGRAEIAYLPFDLATPLDRFIQRFSPRAMILVEGDYWPLALSKMARRGPIMVVNGRMSDRAFSRQEKIGRINRLFYEPVDHFGLQTEEDCHRLERLGVPASRLEVTGNLKFDAAMPQPKEELEQRLLRIADGRPILLAGSTMEGEEEQLLEAYGELEGEALLIVAPRHPERWDSVAATLEASGQAFLRRSALSDTPEANRIEILLLDSLGELAALYRLAQAAFIGGTLVSTGGHNPLEPARFGVPIVVGPSMHNFQEMAERFDRDRAWWRARNGGDLGRIWTEILKDPGSAREVGDRAKALLDANRGAVDRSLAMIQPMLAGLRPSS